MVWRAKNLHQAILPTIFMQALLGYTVFLYPLGRRGKIFSYVYMLTVTALFWTAFVNMVEYAVHSRWFAGAEKNYIAVVSANVAIATMAQILHCIYFTKFIRAIKRLMMVDETLRALGSVFAYPKCFRTSLIMTFIWLMMVVLENMVNALWLLDELPIGTLIFMTCVVHHPIHVNTFLTMNFYCILRQITMRFEKVNQLLVNTFEPDKKHLMKHRSWKCLRGKIQHHGNSNNLTVTTFEDENIITNTLKHVHLELTLVAQDFNNIYGFILLLETAAFFIMFTGVSFSLYIVAKSPPYDKKMIHIIVGITQIISYGLVMFLINDACERVMAQAKKTANLIHGNDSCNDHELHDEFKQFSLQLMDNPLLFSPVGFFTFGYAFIRKFLGAVVTYLVIIIQMGTDPNIRRLKQKL